MKHDPFEYRSIEMTWYDRAWRILFLLGCIAVLACDLMIWRP